MKEEVKETKKGTIFVISIAVVVVCIAGFLSYWYLGGKDSSLDVGRAELTEGEFVPERPGEENNAGEPYLFDMTRPLDGTVLFESKTINSWYVYIHHGVIKEISDNSLTIIPVSLEDGTKADRPVIVILPQDREKLTVNYNIEEKYPMSYEELRVNDVVNFSAIWAKSRDFEPLWVRISVVCREASVEDWPEAPFTIQWNNTVVGWVEKISGRTLTITNHQDSGVDTLISEDTQIELWLGLRMAESNVGFERIELGDEVYVYANLIRQGELEETKVKIIR